MAPTHDLPLSAMLSQLLIAFTLEVDDQFEVALGDAGHPEIGLSLVGHSNFLQYGDGNAVAISDAMERSFAGVNHVAQTAGVYERWNVVEVTAAASPAPVFGSKRKTPKRAGHATSKGITARSVAHLTEIGQVAASVWPEIVKDVEARWSKRFGSPLDNTRKALQKFINESEVDLPDGVYSGWVKGDWRLFPPRSSTASTADLLPKLLSQALMRCTIDFETTSESSIALGSTTLRALSADGVILNELPLRSGVASQMSAVQVNGAVKAGLASFTKDSATGLKAVKLSSAGVRAQQRYHEVAGSATERLGPAASALRKNVATVLTAKKSGRMRIAEGLRPSDGTSRSGSVRPPLGIRPRWERPRNSPPYVGGAQDNRLKELCAQSEALLADPLTYLPHYPVWDQNRGFGP